MRRSRTTVIGLLAAIAALATGLVVAVGGPANAAASTGDVAAYQTQRIADVNGRAFATAATTTQRVFMRAPSHRVDQDWAFTRTWSGYQVTSVLTRGCLKPATRWVGNYPPIVQETCRGLRTELWQLVSITSSTVAFRNVGMSGQCMGIDISGAYPGPLYLYPCRYGASNQQFRLL